MMKPNSTIFDKNLLTSWFNIKSITILKIKRRKEEDVLYLKLKKFY